MSSIKIGLIIQGPISSFGNGPNNSRGGFDAKEVVYKNINTFDSHVDKIIVSTWKGSGLNNLEIGQSAVLLESEPILGFDFLNQRKQFFSMNAGLEWLRTNSDCTHAIKIRTDQLIPLELIDWTKEFYSASLFSEKYQKDYLIFSEGLKAESFYAGDFIIAGTLSDLSKLCNAVLVTKKIVHPMNAADYILKWLQSLDVKYLNGCSPLLISLLTAKNSIKIQRLWNQVLNARISLFPREIIKKIIWRGKPITEVIQSLDTAFFFNEDISFRGENLEDVRSLRKTFKLMREYWRRYLTAKQAYKKV